MPDSTVPIADHPRIRGEHVSNVCDGTMPYGSSPHTRGALAMPVRTHRGSADHPRIRGEHSSWSILAS